MPFSFVYPLFLIGLAAGAIPWILELLHRARLPVVPFPSIRFLGEVQRDSRRRTRLRDILILILRTLGIWFLAIGLARPTIPKAGLGPIVPGEEAVVVRMIYEILKKEGLAFHELIPTDGIIFLREDEGKPGGFSVRGLEVVEGRKAGMGLLQLASPDGTVEGFFQREFPKDVLFLRFRAPADGALDEALEAPVAEVEWFHVDADDNAEAEAIIEQHLLELNRLDPADLSQPECALVLDTADDLVRLKTAIAIREVAQVNNFEELMALRNFRVGRRFVLPEFDPEGVRSYLIDRQVAEYFYKSDYYYHALKEKLEQGYTLLQEALAREGMR